jgi:hypothetical protein
MTFAAVTLLGMTMGQPPAPSPAPDYYPMNSRTIKLPIEYKQDRKKIRQVLLYVARGENTWYQEGFVTPDKDSFVYVAKEDGLYWFKMVIEYMNGTKDPADLTIGAPDLKMVIDATPPQVRVTNARRISDGGRDEIVIEWGIDDKFPNDAETKVHFCATGSPQPKWQQVTRPDKTPVWTGVRFPCGTPDGVTVRITAVDLAGNQTQVTKDFAPASAAQVATTAPPPPVSPPAQTPTAPILPAAVGAGTAPQNNTLPNSGGAAAPPPPDVSALTGPGPITPAGSPPAPITPAGNPPPAPIIPPGPQVPPPAWPGDQSGVAKRPTYQPADYQPPVYQQPTPPAGATGGAQQPLRTVDPKAPKEPAPVTSGAAPANWNGPAPAADAPRAQVIGYPRFDLGYDLEQRGPSGISRVDLWVTRDEGKSWRKWSQHDGKNGAVRVTLDVQQNPQKLEGAYGFRLVPVSGAGLSEREPVANDPPDLRVVLDVTPPQLDLFPVEADPNNPDALVIKWVATDRNFGDEPITLEWSESAAGPWHPIASAGTDPVVQATALNAPVAKRLANTGQYAWRVPVGTPARVYLKATAVDAAGNVTEKVTVDPITVDLTKPRARINGIVPPGPPRP